MNTKRQTIWLVSMLSLMVVLSAYYLFTEDVSKLDLRTDKVAQEDVKVTTEVVTPDGKQAADKSVAGGTSQQSAAAGKATDSAAKTDNSAKADSSAKTDGAAKTDGKAAQNQGTAASATSAQAKEAQVLDQLQKQGASGSDFFAAQEMKRNEELSKKIEQLLNVIADAKKPPEEIAKATDEMEKLQTKQAKVENLEDLLAKDFKGGAIVLEDANKWKVVVHGDKLEKSQAVSIVDLVMKELNITQDKVTVQLMH